MPSGPPRILGCKSFQDLATLQLTVELSHFLKRWNGMSFSPGHHWDQWFLMALPALKKFC